MSETRKRGLVDRIADLMDQMPALHQCDREGDAPGTSAPQSPAQRRVMLALRIAIQRSAMSRPVAAAPADPSPEPAPPPEIEPPRPAPPPKKPPRISMTTVSLEDAAFLLSANAESPSPPAGPAAPAVAEASPPPAADEAPPLRKRRPNATPAEDILSGLADFASPDPPEPAGQPDSPRQKSRGKSGIPDAAAALAALQMLDDATEAQISGQSDEGQA